MFKIVLCNLPRLCCTLCIKIASNILGVFLLTVEPTDVVCKHLTLNFLFLSNYKTCISLQMFRSGLGICGISTCTEHDAVGTYLVCAVLLHAVLARHWQSGVCHYRIC